MAERTIVHECPIDRMPVFVKAGSIVPMAPRMEFIGQKPLDPLALDVYAGRKAAEFNLYEDDGISLDYRKNAYSWTPIRFASDGRDSHLQVIGPSKGKFKGQKEKRRYQIQSTVCSNRREYQ